MTLELGENLSALRNGGNNINLVEQ